MADGKIEIETGIDQSGVNKGVKQVDSTLKKSAKSFTSTFAKMRDVMQGPVAAAGLLKGGLDKVKATIDDLTEAYKTQITAETQLESAVKNNPYLDEQSTQILKDYASSLQNISTTGDEELMPYMAQLASAGRTQDEIMQVMSAALDVAAGGTMGLSAAVTALNTTYTGTVGMFGRQLSSVKNLTTEQLKNGDAVGIVAEKYKGMAEEVAKTTGTAEQLANTMGDLKEELGAPFEKGLSPVRKYFTELISGWTNAMKAKREMEEDILEVQQKGADAELSSINTAGKAKYAEYTKYKTQLSELLQVQKEGWVKGSAYNTLSKKQLEASIAQMQGKANVAKEELKTIRTQYKDKKSAIEADKKAAAEADAAAAENKKNQDATDIINANTAAREEALATLQATADATGETVDIQDKLNAYVQSYVSLVTQNPDLISKDNSAAVALLATTKGIAEEAKKEADALAETASESEKQKEAYDKISDAMEALGLMTGETFDTMKQGILDDINNTNLDVDAKQDLIDKINGITEATTDWGSVASTVYSQLSSLASGYAQLKADEATNAADAYNAFIEQNDDEITALEEKEETASGLTTAEQERLAELNATQKELAQEEYEREVEAFETAQALSIAQTLISGAEAAVKAYNALAGIPVVGPALGIAAVAGISALTAAQVAVIQNQTAPTAPTFTTGGVIGGTSYTGDKLYAPVNSKERVLTPQQNATFEKLVYDGAGVSGGLSTSNISAIAEAVAGMYNQSVNTNVYLDKRVMAKAITTVQKNGDF